jgi:hypothetical protein
VGDDESFVVLQSIRVSERESDVIWRMKENFFKKGVFGMLRDENGIERVAGARSGQLVPSGTL